jgi:ribose 5-phosphate isomerase B
VDAATAAGARKWNDANVLALSLRLLSEPLATEIVSAFLDNAYDGTEDDSLRQL